MQAPRRRSAAAALAVAACVAVSATIAHPVIAAGTGEFCGPGWQRTSTPQVQKVTRFTDIAGVRDDLWAVGHHARGPSAAPSTLAAHWDGSRWTEVPTPDPGDHNTLSGVAAVAPHDVWAVGTADGRAIAEHWNGTTWSVVPMPDPPSAVEELLAVDAVSSDDVWAVGRRGSATTHRSLTMHWNGSAWSVVPSPSPDADGDHLFGVDAVSPARAWAFGATGAGAATDHSPLLLRWNGVGWSKVATSSEAGNDITFRTGMEVASGDLWTMGGSWSRSGPTSGIVQRRRGSAWTTWANPSTRWKDADATSGNDVWVAGEGERASLTAHWDGAGWTSLAAPAHVGIGEVASLHGTTAVARDEVWVVGGAEPFDSSTTASLALRACPMNVTDTGIARASSRVAQGSGTLWRFPAADGAHDPEDRRASIARAVIPVASIAARQHSPYLRARRSATCRNRDSRSRGRARATQKSTQQPRPGYVESH